MSPSTNACINSVWLCHMILCLTFFFMGFLCLLAYTKSIRTIVKKNGQLGSLVHRCDQWPKWRKGVIKGLLWCWLLIPSSLDLGTSMHHWSYSWIDSLSISLFFSAFYLCLSVCSSIYPSLSLSHIVCLFNSLFSFLI